MDIYVIWSDYEGFLWDRFSKDRKANRNLGIWDSGSAGVMSGGRRGRKFFGIILRRSRGRKKRIKRKTRGARRTRKTRDLLEDLHARCRARWGQGDDLLLDGGDGGSRTVRGEESNKVMAQVKERVRSQGCRNIRSVKGEEGGEMNSAKGGDGGAVLWLLLFSSTKF